MSESLEKKVKSLFEDYLAQEVDSVINNYIDQVAGAGYMDQKEKRIRVGMLRELRYRLLGRYES